MNNKKCLILGDIDIQSLINMEEVLTGILREARDKKEEVYRTYQMAAVQALRLVMKRRERSAKKFSKNMLSTFITPKMFFVSQLKWVC